MSGSCTVAANHNFDTTTPFTSADLNAAAVPQVTVDALSIGVRELIPSDVVTVLGTGAAGYNYLDNGGFYENRWTAGTTAVSCPVNTQTFRADAWFCQPAGAAVTYQRVQDGPANGLTVHAAKLTGATGATAVLFGQNIPRRIATALARKLLLSCWIFNSTGASFTPNVIVNACNSADVFTSVTQVLNSPAASALSNGAWTQLILPVDLTGVTTANGIQLVLSFPSGTLAASGQNVEIAQSKLEVTTNTTPSLFVAMRERPDATSATVNAPYNLLVNGQFDRFLVPGSAVACTSTVDTANAEAWFVNAAGSGSTGTLGLSAAGPGNNLTGRAQRFTGGAGVGAVLLGQNLAPAEADKCRRPMVLTLWVRYHDGAGGAPVPTLLLQTPATSGDFAGATTQLSTVLAACADDTWTELTATFDGSALTNIANGLRIALQFDSGTLDAATKWVETAQVLLEEGTAASPFKPYREAAPLFVTGQAANLTIVFVSATATITADEAILADATGRSLRLTALSAVFTRTTSGAGGLDTGSLATGSTYYLFLISNGTALAALASLSATAPTLPAGYTFKAMVGAFVYQGAGLIAAIQYGRRFWFSQLMQVYATAGVIAGTNVSLSACVPLGAKTVFGSFGSTSGTAATAGQGLIAADGNLTGACWLVGLDTGAAFNSAYRVGGNFDCPLTTAQQLFLKTAGTNNWLVRIHGYTW